MKRKTVRYHFCKGCGSYVGGPCLFCRIVGALERGVAALERSANAAEFQAKGLKAGVTVNAEMLRILKEQRAEGQRAERSLTHRVRRVLTLHPKSRARRHRRRT